MLFSTNTVALFAILASALTVAAVPKPCPPGVTVTVTVTDHETKTVSIGHAAPTAARPTSTQVHHSVTFHPTPTPSPTASPGSGNGNANGGSSGNGSGNGGSSSQYNVCCKETGEANSLVISALASLLNINLSGKTGLVGIACIAIGEGTLSTQCGGSLLKCGSLDGTLGLQLGSDCSV